MMHIELTKWGNYPLEKKYWTTAQLRKDVMLPPLIMKRTSFMPCWTLMSDNSSVDAGALDQEIVNDFREYCVRAESTFSH